MNGSIRLMLLLAAVGLLAACGGSSETVTATTTEAAITEAEETAEEATEAATEVEESLEGEATEADFDVSDELGDSGEAGPAEQDEVPDNAHASLGRIHAAGPVPAQLVRRRIIDDRGRWVRHCYAAGLDRDDGTAGDVVIVGTIRPNGQIEQVHVAHNGTGDPALGQCVRGALDSLNFPGARHPRPTHVRAPFRFSTD